MSVTLGNVKDALQARGYGTDTTTAQTEFVKGALRRVYGMRRWRFLEKVAIMIQVTPGDDAADITTLAATAVDSVRLLDGSDFQNMSYIDKEDLFDLVSDDPQTGPPEVWSRFRQDYIQVWPSPDKVYNLHIAYQYMPTMPSADADVLVFPEEYTEVLVEYAVMLMAKRQRDWQAYNAAKADFTDALQDMIRSYAFTQRQTGAVVARWDGWDEVAR